MGGGDAWNGVEMMEGKWRQLYLNNNKKNRLKKPFKLALAVVVEWIEHWPANQRVAGLIPSQGTCLGCRPGPKWGA